MNQLLLITAVCASVLSAMGKTATWEGQVVADDASPVAYAEVSLFSLPDTLMIANTLTDSIGHFSVELKSVADSSIIAVKAMGYNPITMTAATSDLPSQIALTEKSNMLEEVVVEESRSSYKMEGNKLVFRPTDIKHLESRKAPYLLNLVPKVFMLGDNAYVGGSQATIYVNNRRLSSTETTSYLRNLNAAEIDRIEVQDMRSSEESGDVAGGIIRIYTKRPALGLSGTVGLRGGTYKAGYNMINPNINLYWGTENWNIYGSYNFERSKSDTWDQNNNIYPDGSSYFNETSRAGAGYNLSHTFKAGTSATLRSKHQLNLEVNGTATTNPKESVSHYHFTKTQENGSILEDGNSNQTFTSDNLALTGTAQYQYNLDRQGGFVRFLGAFSHVDANSDLTLDAAYTSDSRLDYTETNLSNSNANSYQLQGDFAKTIGGWNTSAGAGYISTHRTSRLNTLSTANAPQQSDWLSDEQITSGYIGANRSFANGIYLSLSLRVENTHVSGSILDNASEKISRQYTDFFPLVYIRKGNSNGLQYGLAYTRTIYRPSFRLLTNYSNRVSNLLYDVGNPDLKRQMSDIVQAQLFKGPHFLLLQYRRKNKPITEVFEVKDDFIYHSNQNIGYEEDVQLNYYYNKKLFPWWMLNGSLNAKYSHLPNNWIDKRFWSGTANLSCLFSINRIGDISVSANGSTNYIYGYSKSKGYVTCNAEYTYFGKQWSASLGVNDIFDGIRTKTRNYTPALDYNVYIKNSTRLFYLSFTYSFSTKAKVSKQKLQFNNDIINRL